MAGRGVPLIGLAGARLRVPARNALLADVVPASVYGRAYGFERAMDNLDAIAGPLLAIGLLAVVSIRAAMYLSVIPGLLSAAAIVYAIRTRPRRSSGSTSRSGSGSGRCWPDRWAG